MASAERTAGARRGGQPAGVREIAARLAEVLGEPLLGEPTRLSSGASRETFRAASSTHGELVVQIDRSGSRAAGTAAQAALLEAAARAGVPAPRVVAHGAGDTILGDGWIVTQALAGTTDPDAILAGEGAPGAPRLLDGIATALAAVHRMEVDPALLPAIDDPLAALRASYEHLAQPHPTFELAFRALEPGPPPGRRTLVHGDFRIGNLMVSADGVTGVLDWELAHLGDPVEDLGWLCVPAWRFRRQDRPAAGLGTRDELLAAYARHAGEQVDPQALGWWELAGTLRWGVICVMQAFAHLSGQIRSVEHAVVGRRACEVEWDLLEMLDPGAPAPPQAPQPPAAEPGVSLHDRPHAVELLRAVRGALGEDVLPLLQGRPEFQVRVSLRALGMVERELVNAPEHSRMRAQTLARLDAADEAELAEAIRRGAFDGREAQLIAGLRALVGAKLAVANPRYPALSGRSTEEAP